MPQSLIMIDDKAFDYSFSISFAAEEGSYAERWAKRYTDGGNKRTLPYTFAGSLFGHLQNGADTSYQYESGDYTYDVNEKGDAIIRAY